MRMLPKWSRTLGIVGVLLMMLCASGVVAQGAQASVGDCGSGAYLCFWKNAQYSDGPGRLASAQNLTSWSHSSCPSGTWNDCISSLYNRQGHCARLYFNAGRSGPLHYLSNGDVYYNLGTQFSDGFNDNISSLNFGASSTC
jgi:hypothetical protein